MSAARSPQSFYNESTPPAPFYAESPETSRQLFKAATTPSPRIKRRRQEPGRSTTPKPEDSRSVQNSDLSSPSRIVETGNEDDIFAPKKRDSSDVPSGFGLGLGIPVLPEDPVEEPVIAWRFSEVSKQSSFAAPSSPSPTESVYGDAGPPGGDQFSIYTLTPGPAWPPPPSTEVSPEPTPRNSMDAEPLTQNRGSGDSMDLENMPLSPLTPAITQLLDEISTMERPPSSNASKTVTQVQAWVMDMPRMEMGRGRGRGDVRVRKMRSWRNLRALGTRTSQFELLRKAADAQTIPSPPITPPGQNAEAEEERQAPEDNGYVHKTPTQLPDSPVEYPFYDDYEDFIEEHLDLAQQEEEAEDTEREEQNRAGLVDSQNVRISQTDTLNSDLENTPRPAVLDSPNQEQDAFEPITPDPNSDLVDEIEALLQSSPLRKQERDRAAASNASTPTQAKISEGMAADLDRTPTQLQPPTFNRNATQETIASQATDSEVFYTPKEARTPFFEGSNPLELAAAPPVPVVTEVVPQTPPLKPSNQSSSSHSTPTRPPIPTRRSSLSHSRNQSTETIPTKSYPPTSHRPGAHIRGKSIDSSSVYNERGRNQPETSRQRSSSANAVIIGEGLRGRGRSRSIEDGPPQIPARRSSVGKTGRPAEVLTTWLRSDSNERPRRPSLGSIIGNHKISDESVERKHSHRFSFSSGVEILGVDEKAEVVSTGVVPSSAVKEVLVRTSSKGTRPAEFPEISVTTPADEKPGKPEFGPRHVPQFSFGEGPDLSLGEGTSASAGKGKERAKDQSSDASQPVVFQLIPPTPAATETSATVSRQLGFQPIQIPGTPQPTTSINGETILRKATPNPVNIVYMSAPSESTPCFPLPTRLPSVTSEVAANRPSTAPEPLIDFENTMPELVHPKRPSLKNRPTGFKKSKLSPWWKPKYEHHHRHQYYNDYDNYDYLADGGSRRPGTSGTTTTITSEGKKKKQHKTVSLGKVQLEFVGVRGLRESYKEMKEEKKRRKMLARQKQQGSNGVPNSPPRLDVQFH